MIDTQAKLFALNHSMNAYKEFLASMNSVKPDLSEVFLANLEPLMQPIALAFAEEARRIYLEDAKQKQSLKQTTP